MRGEAKFVKSALIAKGNRGLSRDAGMTTLFDISSRQRLRRRRLRHTASRRSWLASAIINSIAVKSGAGDQGAEWQTVRPPAFVHIFRRARREEGGSLVPQVLCAGLLCAVCLTGIWFSESGAQARCGEGKPTSGQCVGDSVAGNARRQQRPSGELNASDAHDQEFPRTREEEGNTTVTLKRSDHE